MPEQSVFGVEMAIKSPRIDQIPIELIKEGVERFFDIHKLFNSIQNKDELPEEWKESLIVPI